MSPELKPTLLIVGLAFVVRLAAILLRKDKHSGAQPDTYIALRNQALQTTREKIALPAPARATDPWAAIMDWALPEGTTTVVAISDGTASVYLSSGGGFIGGGQSHESIRQAARDAVATAAEVQPKMNLVKTFPLPSYGEVILYALTDAGVFSATASQAELSANRSPFSKLGDSFQSIITEYRSLDEKR